MKNGKYMLINKYIHSIDSYEVTFSIFGGEVGEESSSDMELTKITSVYRMKNKI